MAYDEGLAERIRNVVDEWRTVNEKKMFGGLAFMLDGHMLCGVNGESLMARVGPEQYEEALAQPGAREMDFTGRPMRGFVTVAPEALESDEALAAWIERCARFVQTLPPKA